MTSVLCTIVPSCPDELTMIVLSTAVLSTRVVPLTSRMLFVPCSDAHEASGERSAASHTLTPSDEQLDTACDETEREITE